jgi:esterase/lipase
MGTYLSRTRFATDIVAEFLPPSSYLRRAGPPKHDSNKVIIFCGGMPGMPENRRVMQYASRKGFWIFSPRYRGTWESSGTFLDHSPHEDILDLIGQLDKPFVSLWDGEKYTIENPEIFVVGASFGGPAAILCSIDARVKKAIALSPVVDWKEEKKSETEPMDWLGHVVKQAFGEAYRYTDADWERLSRGEFYNPVDHISEIDGQKLMIIHAKDDDVVHYGPVHDFANKVSCQFLSLQKGGHFGSRILLRWGVRSKILRFLYA